MPKPDLTLDMPPQWGVYVTVDDVDAIILDFNIPSTEGFANMAEVLLKRGY